MRDPATLVEGPSVASINSVVPAPGEPILNAERIVRLAFQLNCSPPGTALEFALMVAEHCAELADEATGGRPSPAGDAIREAFRIR